MPIQAILFDCDGTLVDTEDLCAQADIDIFAKYGVHYDSTKTFLTEFIGVANVDIIAILNERHGVNIPVDAWLEEYVRLALARIPTDMHVKPESLATVKRLAARGVKMAVASNGRKDVVIRELEVAGYIDVIGRNYIFTVEDVANPKPAPDLYLMAARALGVAPSACIVVEDSAAGAKAGIAAGMKVLGYCGFSHDPITAAKKLENAGCARIINDLSALEAEIA